MDRGNHTAFTGDIAEALNGALEWWRGAGVDCAFDDAPHLWLEEAAAASGSPAPVTPAPPPPEPEPAPIIGGPSENWPDTLPAFAEWWLSEPSLDGGQVHARLAPRGPASPALMVLVPHPEADDEEHLLSGPQGRLLAAILSAMGYAEDAVYIAACLPRHTPLPDWAALKAAGLGALVAHHIALVAPQRLITLGGNVLPLLGHDPAQTTATLPANAQESSLPGLGVPILPAADLAAMLKRPAGKARLWQDWLEWSGQIPPHGAQNPPHGV